MTSLVKRLLPAEMSFWNEDDVEELTFLLYVWVMELLPTRDFGAWIAAYKARKGSQLVWDKTTRDLVSRARSDLRHNADAVRLKLATWKCVFYFVSDRRSAEQMFVNEGLPADCADLYAYLWDDPHFWGVLKACFKRSFSDPVVMQDLQLNFEQLQQECWDDFEARKVRPAVRALVRKHIQWVAMSNNEHLSWLEQDIITNAVAYYYKVRPLKSRLHATNYAKSSIEGRVNQLIAYWKRPENARLREETGSWKSHGNAVVISCNDPEVLQQFEGRNHETWADMAMDLAWG